MPIPAVNMTIEDGALGTLPPNVAGASVKLGVCSSGTANTLTGFSDTTAMRRALGQGPLVEAIAQILDVAGGPVYAMPLTPTVVGTVGSVTHGGTGTGTVTPSRAPDRVVKAKITTAGALATMYASFSVDGGAYGTPVISTAAWATDGYRVPGTLTTLTFPAGTYVIDETYSFSTAGVLTFRNGADSGVGTGPAAVTQVSSPLDAYDVILTITTAGAAGVGAFTYSLDGGNTTSASIAIPGGGVYVIPGTGVVLTFAGTFTEDDTYSFTTVAAGFTGTEVTTGLTALRAMSTEWGFLHVVGTAANAAAAAVIAALVDTQLTSAETGFRFAFGVVECPTAEADATVAAAFASFESARVMVCAGDAAVVSPLTGKILRRNCAWVVTARLALIPVNEDPAWVGRGRVKNVQSIYRNEAETELLDEARFTTMRTHIGKPGYYITNGRMMAAGGSDYTFVQHRRVMDRACQVTRAAELPYLNADVRIDLETGFIDEKDAQQFEGDVNAKLRAAIVAPGYASGSSVVMSRTANLLSGAEQPVSVRVIPKAYLKQIDTSIGFQNPALAL